MTGPGDPVDPTGGGSPNDAAVIRTFLIADVRGWTLFTQERGDEAAAKLAAKFADTVREVVETRGGTLLELRGDEAMCVFTSSREAIRSAVELQVRFAEETVSQPELPLTVGIGLDAGEAVPVEGGYRGGALNLAARLCGQARAGEVLASREVTHLARRLDGVRYEDRGAMSFKNIPDPVEVVRVAPEGEDPIDRLRPFTPTPPAPAKRRSRGWAIAVGIAVVVALVAVAIPLLGADDRGPLNVDANSIARLDPGETALDFATPLDDRPGASATGFGSLWVVQPDRGRVARVDLADGDVIDTIPVGPSPAGIAVGLGSMWVTNAGDGTVSRINADINEITETLQVGSTPAGIAVGDGALWIADTVGAALLRVDPTSGDPQAVELPGQPSGVAFTPDGVWISYTPNAVARIDPTDMAADLVRTVGASPTAIHAAFGSIWVANHLDGTVSRLDPSTGRVQATIDVGEGPDAIADADGSLWVAHAFDDTISRIDPGTNEIVATTHVGATATSLVADRDALWLAAGAPATGHRGGTLTVSSESARPETLDPAVVYDTWLFQILTVTNDGLLAYKKVAGPDGRTLVPDLASALPDVLDDGLTYRFPLRPGIRYSTGEPVRPEDFQRGIERSLLMHDAGFLFGAIAGADACLPEDPEAIVTTCDLSDSIVVDEGSVTFHLAFPDATLPFKLAMPYAFPVPADTPAEDQGLDPLPATGPYQIVEIGSDGIELRRNPEFREWSGAAQPEGFVDAISYRFGEDPVTSFDRLEAGALDIMIDDPTPEDLGTLRSTHPDQVVPWPGSSTLFVGFDVQKPPYDDRRVRQALSYAIDREHVVELLGGPTVQRPTCQILPPGLEGYEPFCPFTLEPENDVWTAPDPDRAQALMEESGAVGSSVDGLVPERGIPAGAVETMEYVVDVLEDLGIRVDLEVEEDDGAYFAAIMPPTGRPGSPAHPHVFMSGWLSEYPAAGDFIQPQFHCDGFANPSGWCSEGIDAKMEEALQLSLTEPGEANRSWAAIEREIVDEAVFVPLTNPVSTQAISDRVENVQIHPQWGLLFSRLWVT